MIEGLPLNEIPKIKRKEFDCGNQTLNDYFYKYAKQDERKGLAKCHVAVEQGLVLGFFTLSAYLIQPENAATPYRYEPGVLLGRLAVDKQFQHRGIGRLLIYKAMEWVCESPIGVKFLLVRAKNDKVKNFYTGLGFSSFNLNDPLDLCFNLKNLKHD